MVRAFKNVMRMSLCLGDVSLIKLGMSEEVTNCLDESPSIDEDGCNCCSASLHQSNRISLINQMLYCTCIGDLVIIFTAKEKNTD